MEPRQKILQEDEEDLTCSSVVADNISLCNEEDDNLEKTNRPWGIKLPLSNKCSAAIALVLVIGIFAVALTASREPTHESSRVSSQQQQQQQLVTVASGRSSCDGTSLRIDLVTDNYGCVSYYVFNDMSKPNTLFFLSLTHEHLRINIS